MTSASLEPRVRAYGPATGPLPWSQLSNSAAARRYASSASWVARCDDAMAASGSVAATRSASSSRSAASAARVRASRPTPWRRVVM